MNRALIEARKAKGLSQAAMANLIGVTPQAYQRYEAGTRTPSVEMAIRVAAALSRPVEELFGELARERASA